MKIKGLHAMLLGQIKLNLRRWDALEEEETTFNGLIPFNGPKLTTLTLQAMDSRSVAPRLGKAMLWILHQQRGCLGLY